MAVDRELQRTLDALESQRVGSRGPFNAFLFVGIPAGVAGLVAYLVHIAILPWVLFAVPIWLFLKAAAASGSVVASFRRRVLPRLVAEIDPDLRYEPIGMLRHEFRSGGLFPDPDTYESKDLVHGAVKGIRVRFALVRASRQVKELTGKVVRESIFDGLLFTAEFNKRIAGTTRVLPGGTTAVDSMDGTHVLLENPQFNEEFHVRSTDQVEARYILTPSMMESIVKLKEQFSSVHLQFSGNTVLIALPTDYDLFEPDLNEPFGMAQITRILGHLATITNLVKYFDLDTRIWSKPVAAPAAPSGTPPSAAVPPGRPASPAPPSHRPASSPSPADDPLASAAPAVEFSDTYAILRKVLVAMSTVAAFAVWLAVSRLSLYSSTGRLEGTGTLGLGLLLAAAFVGFKGMLGYLLLAAGPLYMAQKRKRGGLSLLAGVTVVATVFSIYGLTTPTAEVTEPRVAATPFEEIPQEPPAQARDLAPSADTSYSRSALSDEDLAVIPIPRSSTRVSASNVERIRAEAKTGNVSGVEAIARNTEDAEVRRFKRAVLEAMATKRERMAEEEADRQVDQLARRIASSPNASALTEADLAKLPAPRLEALDASSRAQIEGIRDAAKAGNTSYIKAVLPEEIGNEVDHYKEAVLGAMTAKAERTYTSLRKQEPGEPVGTAPTAPRNPALKKRKLQENPDSALSQEDLVRIRIPGAVDQFSYARIHAIVDAARAGDVAAVDEVAGGDNSVGRFKRAVLAAMEANAARAAAERSGR